MDLNRIITVIRTLKESPTNNTGSNGSTAGFSSDASETGPVAGYDKRLFPAAIDLLSQDYQSPGESGLNKWRFSNVYPVEKLSEKDIDNMVDASKEFMNVADNSNSDNLSSSRLETIMNMVRGLKEETVKEMMTTGSSGGVAGFSNKAPAEGPTAGYDKKLGKKKKAPIIARGLLPGARKRWSNGK